MDNLYIKSLAVLAVIVYTVFGLDYVPRQAEQEFYHKLGEKTKQPFKMMKWASERSPGEEYFYIVLSYLPGSFSFFSCSRKNSILNFTELIISPDPILFNRWNKSQILVFGKYNLTETISPDQAIEADIRLRLKIQGGYTELCELIGEEKCHFSDLIQELKKEYAWSAKILLTKGEHLIPNVGVMLTTLPFTLKGRFEATLYMMHEGQPLGCLCVRFCVTECMFYP